MKIIQLTQGYQTVIDDIDFEDVSKFSWYASTRTDRGAPRPYARTHEWREGKRITLQLHVFIMEQQGIKIPNGVFVDHKDNNSLNNMRENLRIATISQNLANKGAMEKTSKLGRSQYKGVFWNKRANKWEAGIGSMVDGKRKKHYLGVYIKEEDAARAYDVKAVEFFGEFAFLNFKELDVLHIG